MKRVLSFLVVFFIVGCCNPDLNKPIVKKIKDKDNNCKYYNGLGLDQIAVVAPCSCWNVGDIPAENFKK